MAAVITSPADVLNVALRKVGYRLRVSSLLDGSEAASFALDLYGQTRDHLLRTGKTGMQPWDFAQRQVQGTVVRTAPAAYSSGTPWDPDDYPFFPWLYEYEWPEDCLKVRAVRPLPAALFDPAPTSTLFTTANENLGAGFARSILANVPNALIIYTGQVTNPASWSVDFVEVLSSELAERLAKNLANLDVVKLEALAAANETAVAERVQG